MRHKPIIASGQSLDRLQIEGALKNLRRWPRTHIKRVRDKIKALPTDRLYK